MSTAIPTHIEKCKGAMLATAIGDALGWPYEPRSKNKIKNSKVNDYFVEWTRRNNKPCYHDEKILPGEYSDDTQMTLSVARSIITGNWEKFFAEKELPFWLNYERGGGGALLKAAKSCKEGSLLWQSSYTKDYFNAGGNGAVMRILPHVIASAQTSDIKGVLLDVIKDAIITHGHPRAILGTTCYAYALDYLLRKDAVLEYGELVTAVIEGKEIWGAYLSYDAFGNWLNVASQHSDYEYATEWENTRSRMLKQLEFIKDSLKKGLMLDDTKVLTQLECFSTANGAGDVAILAAIYLASRYATNPTLGIKVPAFSFGIDTDTIASITGGLLGMLCGMNWIPIEWKVVQDYDCLIRLTDLLLANNSKHAEKADVTEAKTHESDWVNTAIGRMSKIGTATVPNGKYAIVTITKWESALGQTLYTKDMQKLDNQPKRTDSRLPLPQQPSLYDMDAQPRSESKPPVQVQITLPVQEITPHNVVPQKKQRQLVLDKNGVNALLDNSKFKKNITIGKVLKIVQTLIEGNDASEAIAKQFEVEQVMVDLIKTYVKT
ncbi:MAG: ADP-ribosylglycohydrolase family protein [Syntrophomonas sp.]